MGRESINDLAEGTIINAMKTGDVGAAKFWLHNNKKNYIHPRPKFYNLGSIDPKRYMNSITFEDMSKEKIDTDKDEPEIEVNEKNDL